jgi:hypothetical protein
VTHPACVCVGCVCVCVCVCARVGIEGVRRIRRSQSLVGGGVNEKAKLHHVMSSCQPWTLLPFSQTLYVTMPCSSLLLMVHFNFSGGKGKL